MFYYIYKFTGGLLMKKPKERSNLRLHIGQIFFILKRYFDWYFSNVKYASEKKMELKKFKVVSHHSPILRKLKNVDMWMQHNKETNLKLAIEKIDRIVLNPEETFSFWKLVGRTTKRKGFLKGMVLTQGNFMAGIGGGLCQLSNLIYWITLHTPLHVTERYRHSYDVFPDSKRTQPFGSGATVSYNYIDLQIKNNTDQPYQLHLYIDDNNLYGEWRTISESVYTYEVYQKKHWITHEYWGGYIRHNEIFRKVFNLDNELVSDEYITENHAIMMYQPLIEKAQ